MKSLFLLVLLCSAELISSFADTDFKADTDDKADTYVEADTDVDAHPDVKADTDVVADAEVEVKDWGAYCTTTFPGLCESQSFKHGCTVYTFYSYPRNFTDAEFFCRRRARGGHLASVHSSYINRALTCLTTHCNSVIRVWLGAYELFRSRRFVWTDGSRWNYANWVSSWPRYYSMACVELNWGVRGQWSDHSCNIRKPFVCEHRH
ncbi:lectin-like [Acipenser ruthenus]|uniref:lectin-like n=1 Tax=Acipenser ruthenus TaxID=7906 RepID=UPI00156152E6|nr:lectin-like [Acipenser ruthenus]